MEDTKFASFSKKTEKIESLQLVEQENIVRNLAKIFVPKSLNYSDIVCCTIPYLESRRCKTIIFVNGTGTLIGLLELVFNEPT